MARSVRPPVIAVMGHIDHGKSSLLDYIRKSNVVAGEAGGITQHVAAYVAEHAGRKITFLDTPGHEAFKALRERGAQAADIAILVVAADEGVMPQTLDALTAIREAKIPFVVAITKIDKNNADIERAKMSLLEYEVFLEGLGGDVPYSPISNKSGQGIPELLDLVLLAADMIEPMGDPESPAVGFVLESAIDPKRGAAATIIIKDGTLHTGDFAVAEIAYAPVRFIENFLGERIPSAGPSEPIRVYGFSMLPHAGTPIAGVSSKKDAEKLVSENAKHLANATPTRNTAEAGQAQLSLVVKADVQGSVDAIRHELAKIHHERVALSILDAGVGAVSESDVKTAAAAGGVVISFNIGTDGPARELALRDHVDIENFSIIYELNTRVAELLAERSPKIAADEELGRAQVLRTFSSGSKRQVLGLKHLSGILTVGNLVKIMRKDEEHSRGKLANLQVMRSDVKEIKSEGEFGAELEAKEDAAPGDVIVAFRVTES